jgi:hypothetical protein
MGQAMVAAGHAEVHNANGKVKSVRLVTAASTHAQIIFPPSTGWPSPRFSLKEKLDGGGIVWKHHPRCRDYEP